MKKIIAVVALAAFAFTAPVNVFAQCGGCPDKEQACPAKDGKCPAAEGKCPAAEGKCPAKDGKCPASDSQKKDESKKS